MEYDGLIDDIMMTLGDVYDLYVEDVEIQGDKVTYILDDAFGTAGYDRTDSIVDMVLDTFEDAGYDSRNLKPTLKWDVLTRQFQTLHFYLPN